MARLMKNSGVQWIGDIPQHWNIVKVKNLFNIGRGRVISQLELDENGIYPVYSSQTKNNGCLGYINTYDFDINQLTWTTDGANAGTVFLRTGKHNCTNVCGTLQLKLENNCLKYLKYTLEHIAFYHKREDTNGYKIMNNEMANISIILPPLEEQQRIANYLDEKCSKIDETIEKEKAIIEKLKEYKQSLITETVTKGVNPNVPLKDSGIDWIGSIPQHWDCVKLKKMLSYPLQYGANASGEIYDDKKPRYIRITDITMDNKLKEEGKLSLNFNDAEPYILQDGDILFARSGATVGKTFIYYKKYGFCAFAGYLIKATPNCKMIPKFLYYYTLSNSYEQWKNQIFIQATIQNIGADKYSNMQLTFPPMEEQKEIAKYLDEKCNAIDNAITQRETLIDKLTQYKKSLIYECVTGKKEV